MKHRNFVKFFLLEIGEHIGALSQNTANYRAVHNDTTNSSNDYIKMSLVVMLVGQSCALSHFHPKQSIVL